MIKMTGRSYASSVNVNDVLLFFREQLHDVISPREEIDAIAYLSLGHVLGLDKAGLFRERSRPLSAAEWKRIRAIISSLKKNKPVQYILGRAHFYGMHLQVNKHVLIPRPETEELVQWIVSDMRPAGTPAPLRILDIGTGSGCIAIALKKNLPCAAVTAMDVSARALSVARENARNEKQEIKFIRADILDSGNLIHFPKYHIIVSNPPYIPLSEKYKLLPNVRNYEPHTALFTQNDNPLFFYRAITSFAVIHLVKGGLLYLECHRDHGSDVCALLEREGFHGVVLKKDLNGNDRMVKAVSALSVE